MSAASLEAPATERSQRTGVAADPDGLDALAEQIVDAFPQLDAERKRELSQLLAPAAT